MFNHPTNYPCRNQNLNNPEGEGPVISSLLKAKANGLGNFASQWLALMASGQYGSPAEALDNINWATVSASNTNDLIDGSLANNALLQAAIAMLNQAEMNGCEFTVDQAWEALSEQSSQIGCLLNTAQQIGGIPPAQFNALLRNLDMACTFSTFLGQQNNSSEARTFVTDMITEILNTNWITLSTTDLNSIFDSFQLIDDVTISLEDQASPSVSASKPIPPRRGLFWPDATFLSARANAQIKNITPIEHRELRRFVLCHGILLEWRWVKKRPERGGGDALIYLGEHLRVRTFNTKGRFCNCGIGLCGLLGFKLP